MKVKRTLIWFAIVLLPVILIPKEAVLFYRLVGMSISIVGIYLFVTGIESAIENKDKK